MAKLHETEVLERDSHEKSCFWRVAVPGGWLYERVRRQYAGQNVEAFALSATFVPDPTAEHVKAAMPGLLVTGGECPR